jgi:hypothetical protein
VPIEEEEEEEEEEEYIEREEEREGASHRLFMFSRRVFWPQIGIIIDE